MHGKFKPIGWRGDSYRHYLAAKGVKTARQSPSRNVYFNVRNELKGNRGFSRLKSLYARGYNDEQIVAMYPELKDTVELKDSLRKPSHRWNYPDDFKVGPQAEFPTSAPTQLPQQNIPSSVDNLTPVGRPESTPSLFELPASSEINSSDVSGSKISDSSSSALTPPLPLQNEAPERKTSPVSNFEPVSTLPGNTVMTPGVPPPQNSFSFMGDDFR